MSSIPDHCSPCEKGTPHLSLEAAKRLLHDLPEWNISGDARWLSRKFTFENFSDALGFVNMIGSVAEQENHHPDVELGWGYALIKLQTHDAGGVHMNDFVMAKKISAMA